jgi:hypothetical protein
MVETLSPASSSGSDLKKMLPLSSDAKMRKRIPIKINFLQNEYFV